MQITFDFVSQMDGKPTVLTIIKPWSRLRQFQLCQFLAHGQTSPSTFLHLRPNELSYFKPPV